MKSLVQAVLSVSLLAMAAGALLVTGCDTWKGLGKDIGSAGDSMAGKGKYTMIVNATPEKVTAAARKAVEELEMTDIEISGDRSEGRVKAKTAAGDKVRIDIKQSGDTDSKVTIRTHGDDADEVNEQIQDLINSNL